MGPTSWIGRGEGSAFTAGQRICSSEKGGAATAPNPTDRGKPGTRRHVVVDGHGTPPGLTLSPANRNDGRMTAASLHATPAGPASPQTGRQAASAPRQAARRQELRPPL